MSTSYPLRFQPILRRYLWGGRRLETLLGKPLPPGDDYAESWELVDREGDQSVVVAGPRAGATLAQLIAESAESILGDTLGAQSASRRFPLLFKFLDAHQPLSVQVHPTDEQAARQATPDLGKTEAWVILHADPGAVLYAGLKRGVDRAALEREVRRGTTHLCLQRVEPLVGECYFIPAGTIHALGAGLVVAEVQQSSDSTYRLFDWNRLGTDGRPRPLHIEQALDVTDYARGPIAPQIPRPTATPGREQLVACDRFRLDRWRLDGPTLLSTSGRFQVLMVTEGAIRVAGDASPEPLRKGETLLVPAAIDEVRLDPVVPTTLLVTQPPE